MFRIGLIGFGGFGPFLRQAWEGLAGVRVVAIADQDPTRAPGDAAFYATASALLNDAAIDLAAIALPPAYHADVACAALTLGLPVLIEKPVATSLRDVDRIAVAQAESGQVATVDFMLRFNPIVEAMTAWSHDQPFGPLQRVTLENYAQDEQLGPDHWFWKPEISGGILIEHAVHFIDVVRACTEASIRSTKGYGLRRDDGRMDRMGLTVLFEDGVVMSQYHAFNRPGFFEETTLRFVFERAQVDVQGWIPLQGRVSALLTPSTAEVVERLPGFAANRYQPIREVADQSRPAGWGSGSRTLSAPAAEAAPTHLLEGSFALPRTKTEAYTNALQRLLLDVRTGISDPEHALRVTLDHGRASLAIALEASRQAGLRG